VGKEEKGGGVCGARANASGIMPCISNAVECDRRPLFVMC
jgi:hypothetical protein